MSSPKSPVIENSDAVEEKPPSVSGEEEKKDEDRASVADTIETPIIRISLPTSEKADKAQKSEVKQKAGKRIASK